MKGQLELFPQRKGLIYYKSLTCYKTICPYCKADNPDVLRDDTCFYCGREFDPINLTVKRSKDLEEVEALGLKGAVRKNSKGKWEEVNYERGGHSNS